MNTAFACRRNSAPSACSITWEGGGYVVKFPYDQSFIERFKNLLNYKDRAYDKTRRAWIVSPDAIALAADLLNQHYGTTLEIPPATDAGSELTGDVRLEYLGAAKERAPGEAPSSMGYANGQWSVEIPQSVLEAFFAGRTDNKTAGPSTLFSTLLISEDADSQTIKTAYRRLARQWHPDVCQEPNAAEQFRAIQEAYETLSDNLKRGRYLAGLYFERQDRERWNAGKFHQRFVTYVPPLRCGVLNVTGVMRVGRLVVNKINAWADIVNDRGQVMVSSWPKGAEQFRISWVNQEGI